MCPKRLSQTWSNKWVQSDSSIRKTDPADQTGGCVAAVTIYGWGGVRRTAEMVVCLYQIVEKLQKIPGGEISLMVWPEAEQNYSGWQVILQWRPIFLPNRRSLPGWRVVFPEAGGGGRGGTVFLACRATVSGQQVVFPEAEQWSFKTECDFFFLKFSSFSFFYTFYTSTGSAATAVVFLPDRQSCLKGWSVKLIMDRATDLQKQESHWQLEKVPEEA